MKKYIAIVTLILIFGFFISCEKENQPPIIQSITASPQSIKTGETTQLSCVATDPEGDNLTYSWSSINGTFPSGTSRSSVTWKAPDKSGMNISVIVNDGQNVVNGTVNIEIMQTSVVEGYVYYSGTLIPVPGVTVSIDKVGYTTRESGHYILQNVLIGNQTISAKKLNFDNFSQVYNVQKSNNTINIEMTSDRSTHNVSGKVSDEVGNNLSGVIVSLLNPDGNVSNLTTSSDATGFYQLPSVPEGSRIITFEKKGYLSFQAAVIIAYSDYLYNAKLKVKELFGEFT
ncbi:MAG: carboxypeptidase regulatory-like domain-containing protein, partial [Mariniphaga sp.]|nr:carboxypeptidase regulatory-like domain-containing protein [Mariniphaga sp.]